MASAASNKAKIARRVIEVLEYFDEDHPQATVMDIVRRFDRPQSSTSELLASLVDLGLLYKDPYSRSYSPTPRAAMLASTVQPDLVRDGRITGLIDRLSAQTGLSIALFGMVGMQAQIWNWRPGNRAAHNKATATFAGGQQDLLSETAVGWLLLSTVEQPRRDGLIRRLNAEAPYDRKFAFSEMSARVQQCQDEGHVSGPAGFDSEAQLVSMLLPKMPDQHPMAIAFVYQPSQQIDRETLLRSLRDGLDRCEHTEDTQPASVRQLFKDSWYPELEHSRA